MALTRRELLIATGLTAAGAVVVPSIVHAQAPKRGGTLTLRMWDPPHFDPHLTISYKTHHVYTFKDLKSIGIDVKLVTKEYGAYIATTFYGKYDSMAFGPQTPFLEPDNFLYGQYYPGELKNHGHINDPRS